MNEYVTTRELSDKLDSTYDSLDAKIGKVDDKLDATREEVAGLRADVLWIKRLGLPAVAAIVALVPEIARAIT